MAEFHERLRAARIKSGKTQKQMAEFLEMTLRPYQYYEEGKTEPSIKKLKKLADYFDVTLDYLTGRTDA